MSVHMQDRVALVTGGGRGLGFAHAQALGRAGATVVVNDSGVGLGGAPDSGEVAAEAVAKLHAEGITAVASNADVSTHEGASAAVNTALEEFGRLDALVTNAGVLRDRSARKMTFEDVDEVLRVHLAGTLYCALAAWPALERSETGRVVLTSSASGLYGNFGQVNYAAAKAGMVGVAKTLAQEGARSGVKVNVIAPVARTRMTEGLLPADALPGLGPERVSPLVAYLSSALCQETGQVLEVGAGLVARIQVVESDVVPLPADGPDMIERIAETIASLGATTGGSEYPSSAEALGRIIEAASKTA